MIMKLLVTIGLLAAAGLAIVLYGFGIPAAVLSVSSLTALYWWFIRDPERKEKSPAPPVSCCHYLGDIDKDEKDRSR
ncbi:hypothetical protein SAMN02745220_02983 [Desulfopila aestuarii DSM 18488]|uniref:Uncharacterized protein n=2 Tax=Desulfopila aestuarii TaxID=231440 RepID=A0A1M7YAL8_9BACT|nr:hypothetical protein SAMN02745220_02983 [Desulfopila aestuarii DSM 18488]